MPLRWGFSSFLWARGNSFQPGWWGIRPSKNCPRGWSGLELTDTLFIYVLIKKSYIWNHASLAQKSGSTCWYGGAYAWSGLYEGGAYTWSNTCVKENVSLSVEGPVHGKLIGREIWYFFVAIVQKLPKEWPLITDYNSPTENVSKVPT